MSNKFQIAHIAEQGQQIIIVLMADEFENRSSNQQQAITSALQVCARRAGLAGQVVPVWRSKPSGFKFIAPSQWHAYFKSIDYVDICASVNKELTCA